MRKEMGDYIVTGISLALWGLAIDISYDARSDKNPSAQGSSTPIEQITKAVKDAPVTERVQVNTTIFDCNKEIITAKWRKAILCFPKPTKPYTPGRVTPF